MKRAKGNVQDLSNLGLVRFGVGEQTGLFTYSSDFSLQFAGAEFTGEFARTHRFSRFPARQEGEAIYGTASAFSERGSAFFVNGTRWFGRWLLGGELFAINPDYQTTLRTYQDEVAGLGPLGAMANETMYWDLVQDNEDGDAYPDRRSGTLRAFPRDRKGDDRNDVLIGVDEDQDGLPDTNRNFNGLPDYLEPFLLYHVEANGYRYGLDRNNNDEPDAIEDDLDWDYPYDFDQRGYHLFGRATFADHWSLTLGRYAAGQVAGAGRNISTYGILRFQWQSQSRLKYLLLENHLRRVKDDIPDEHTVHDERLQQVDADVDLGRYDNDGPDGVPNSGDDDGRVDYLCISVLSTPRNFILGGATGIAGLRLRGGYQSMDAGRRGRVVWVGGEFTDGAIFKEGSFAQTVGSMAHEFGHALDLPDLYDTKFDNPDEESAGIGCWGLMGWGAHGWNGDDGPNGFSAWSLEQLGWIGPDNERLVEVREDARDIVVTDLYQQGVVYKVPLRTEYIYHERLERVDVLEYLLLEQRVRSSHHYNRHLPAEGLLVWHVRPSTTANLVEEDKLVDLVCADGLYRDAGYSMGQVADPLQSRDNLDFWSRDSEYSLRHGGNLGDASDLFDGVHFTYLNRRSNPATSPWREFGEANTGVAFENMRRMGAA